MTPILTAFSIAAIAVIYAILAERDCRFAERKWEEVKRERDYWRGACRRSYGATPGMTEAKARQIMHDLFADELLIGTQANPLRLWNGDTARYSTLDSLIATRTLGE